MSILTILLSSSLVPLRSGPFHEPSAVVIPRIVPLSALVLIFPDWF
jgi:hypothetical protein